MVKVIAGKGELSKARNASGGEGGLEKIGWRLAKALHLGWFHCSAPVFEARVDPRV